MIRAMRDEVGSKDIACLVLVGNTRPRIECGGVPNITNDGTNNHPGVGIFNLRWMQGGESCISGH